MSFKIGKIAVAKITVKVLVPDGEVMREEKLQVGIKIYSNTEYLRLRQALIDGGSKDVDGDFLKQHAITSVETVQFEDGTALTVEEAIDVPYLRAPIDTSYQLTLSGVKRKN